MAREENLNKLLSALESIHPLTVSLSKALVESTQDRTMHKKATILYEGGTQHSLWYIIQGFAREYVNDPIDWDESTSWFWQAGDFVFHEGFFAGNRSKVSIDFYSEAILLEVDFLDILKLHIPKDEINLLVRSMESRNQSQRKEHLIDLSNLTRMEHVKKFYRTHKPLFNYVRHKDLASFLGIKDKSIYRYLKGL